MHAFNDDIFLLNNALRLQMTVGLSTSVNLPMGMAKVP